MSCWSSSLVTMLRTFINDIDSSNYTYTDSRLQQLLVIAAMYVKQEIDFDTTYTVDVAQVTISPDPVDTGDDAFSNFVVLKAACLSDQGMYRSRALAAGLKARIGPAALDTVGHLAGFKELLTEGPCAAYVTLKKEWLFGNAYVRAILGPFISNTFDPRSLSAYHSYKRYN